MNVIGVAPSIAATRTATSLRSYRPSCGAGSARSSSWIATLRGSGPMRCRRTERAASRRLCQSAAAGTREPVPARRSRRPPTGPRRRFRRPATPGRPTGTTATVASTSSRELHSARSRLCGKVGDVGASTTPRHSATQPARGSGELRPRLACTSMACRAASARWNYPTHLGASLLPDVEPQILHFHRELTADFALEEKGVPLVDTAIARINDAGRLRSRSTWRSRCSGISATCSIPIAARDSAREDRPSPSSNGCSSTRPSASRTKRSSTSAAVTSRRRATYGFPLRGSRRVR